MGNWLLSTLLTACTIGAVGMYALSLQRDSWELRAMIAESKYAQAKAEAENNAFHRDAFKRELDEAQALADRRRTFTVNWDGGASLTVPQERSIHVECPHHQTVKVTVNP